MNSLSSYIATLKESSLARKIPNISEENARFLQKFLQTKKPKNLLEIGTANGYSTLVFYDALTQMGENVHITTIEHAANAHTEAIEHFSICKIKNIFAIYGDAKSVIPKLKDDFFDFVFIDAMKREYLDYLTLVLPKLTKNATIIIDDAEKYRHKMEALYDFLDSLQIPYILEKTDPDDSVMIIEKKDFL